MWVPEASLLEKRFSHVAGEQRKLRPGFQPRSSWAPGWSFHCKKDGSAKVENPWDLMSALMPRKIFVFSVPPSLQEWPSPPSLLKGNIFHLLEDNTEITRASLKVPWICPTGRKPITNHSLARHVLPVKLLQKPASLCQEEPWEDATDEMLMVSDEV